jgi:ATP-dependent protease Clp ATPase subunit
MPIILQIKLHVVVNALRLIVKTAIAKNSVPPRLKAILEQILTEAIIRLYMDS